MENKRVLLGMSGGVDSSVSAVLLKQNGYDVIGATMELFSCGSCCNINTYIDAKNVCNQIGVPHFTCNYQKEFKEHVINDFIECYKNCKTCYWGGTDENELCTSCLDNFIYSSYSSSVRLTNTG